MKNKAVKASSVPRSIEDITKEYVEMKNKLADCKYQVYIFELEVADACKRMLELNKEGAERNTLNAEIEKQLKKDEESDVKS
jgi:hypothetical protein